MYVCLIVFDDGSVPMSFKIKGVNLFDAANKSYKFAGLSSDFDVKNDIYYQDLDNDTLGIMYHKHNDADGYTITVFNPDNIYEVR